MTYRMGIVGLGKMGGFHADWIAKHPQMELAGYLREEP